MNHIYCHVKKEMKGSLFLLSILRAESLDTNYPGSKSVRMKPILV